MDKFNLQSHFVIPVLLSILILGILLFKGKKLYKDGKWKAFWISLTVFFIIYLLLLLIATYVDNYYDLALQSFDLNGDGNFSVDERTPEQKIAMKKVTADTGRTFAPYTGIIISGFISFTVFVVGKTVEYLRRKKGQ